MKRLMVIVAAALFGAAALTGCSSSATTDVEPYASTEVSASVAEAKLTSGVKTEPSWLEFAPGGVHEGHEYLGSVNCHGDVYPVELDADTQVEFKEGNLYFSFDEKVPPGVILHGRDGWVVVNFDTPGATSYRVDGQVTVYADIYPEDPTMITTCWP